MKKDIQSREDIKLLIDMFYDKILVNPLLQPIFIDIAHIDLKHHLPILYDFWSYVLLGEMGYNRNVMEPHIRLNQKITLTQEHFDEWMRLFTETVDEYFEGTKAGEAKSRAKTNALLMQHKIKFMPKIE